LSLEAYLAEISHADRPLAISKLANLSELSAEELASFVSAWADMDLDRRRQVTSHLADLAEENPNLNFNGIFMACLNDPDETVRLKAIDGLWECESRSLIDALIIMLKEDDEETVRAAAATALGRFAMRAELGKSRPEDRVKVENALLAAIESTREPIDVARRAVEAIAPLNVSRVKQLIEQAYRSDDFRMRVSAIYAMGRNCDPAWLPTLLRELGNADAEMRYEAAAACGELAEEDAVPHLGELINDIDSEVRLSAIAALGKIGSSEAEGILHVCLEHSDELVREAAGAALEELSFEKDPMSFRIE